MKSETIIEIIGLTKTYHSREGRITAVSELNLAVGAGEILGLLGPNGAGKTTLVKMIMGFIRPSRGKILYRNSPLSPAEPRPDFGYLPENFRPNPDLTVFEYMTGQLALSAGRPDCRSAPEVEALLRLVGMDKYLGRKIHSLSKGMGQRVGLAQAFSGAPRILILDEPTSGLDPIGRHEVMEILKNMKQAGKTIFFCSHILSEADRLCDRIGVMAAGRLSFIGSPRDFKSKWSTDDLEKGFVAEVQCAAS